MTTLDPTALHVEDDDEPGVLETPGQAPIATLTAEPPPEPAEPAEPLAARLDRIDRRFVSDELRQECQRVDALVALARQVEDARRDAEHAVDAALAAHEPLAAIEAELTMMAAERVASKVPPPVFDRGIISTSVQRALAAARSAVPDHPPMTQGARQLAEYRRLARRGGASLVDPPPTTAADRRAAAARAEALPAIDGLVAAVAHLTESVGRPGVDVISLLGACASIVDQAKRVSELAAKASDLAVAADELREAEGLTWRDSEGHKLIF